MAIIHQRKGVRCWRE